MEQLFKNKYRIKSTRLKYWDYSSNGYYFITICTKNRECVFGNVKNGRILLSPIGEIVRKYWFEIPKHFQNVISDQFVIMPNHLHGIVIIDNDRDRHHMGQIVGYFKYQTTKLINKIYSTPGNQIWQPRFYEHIIRNETILNAIREYITNNPSKWELDQNNPNKRKI